MPGQVRTDVDKHIGHASPTPNPFHQTAYNTGSDNVIVNSKKAVRGEGTDSTACGDKAVGSSSNVIINGKGAHRKGDGTSGHGSWPGNAAASGSENVIVNG